MKVVGFIYRQLLGSFMQNLFRMNWLSAPHWHYIPRRVKLPMHPIQN